MTRARLSQALATSLGLLTASGGALSMCGSGMEINGVKMSPTGIRIDQVNISGGGSAPAGMDERAGQKGATEYEGRPLKCRDEGDGTRFCW